MARRLLHRFPLICALLCVSASAQTPAHEALASALDELDRGAVIEAIDKLKRIARDEPAFGAARFYLSTLYTEMGEPEIALGYLQQAIDADAKRAVYYHQLGVIRHRQRRWREALASFEMALMFGMGRDEHTVWRRIGDVHVELFDRDRALDAYEHALRLQPEDARTRLALGKFYLERNDLEKAIVELKAAVRIDSALPEAHASLGQAYRRLGDKESAVATLKKAIDASPSDQRSRYILGQTLVETGRVDEGRDVLNHYQRVEQQIFEATANLDAASALLESGELDRAEKLLTQAVDLAPSYGPGLHKLGSVLLDHGRPERAVGVLKRAVEVNPLYAASYFSLGSAYLVMNRLTDALEATRRAIVIYDLDPRYHRQIGEIFIKLNRPQDARKAFEQADRLVSR